MADDHIKKEEISKDEDNKFEYFVLEQVRTYADTHRTAAKLYLAAGIAAIVMCIVGLSMGKSAGGAFTIAVMGIGFIGARFASIRAADSVDASAAEIEKAIEDPDFRIPEDYPEDIMALRRTVCPSLKNTRSMLLAYGICGLMCWAGFLFMLWVTTFGSDDFVLGLFLLSWVLGGFALWLTVLALRAWKNLPVAKAYEDYMNRKALEK